MKNAGLDQQFVHQSMILGIVFSILFYGAQAIYLVLSKNFRGVYLLCKIILVLDIIGSLIIPFSFFGDKYGYSLPLKIYIAVSGLAQLALIVTVVRQLSKAKTRELKYSPSQPKSKLFRTKPKNYVPPKPLFLSNTAALILKLLFFRIAAPFWGLALIYIGVLVSYGPSAHPVTLGAPLIILGILYLVPYYVLNRDLTIAYTSILIFITALTVYLLHMPLGFGLPAPASIPFTAYANNTGHTFDITVLYASQVFHSMAFVIPLTLVISVDAILRLVKYAAIPDNLKQSIRVMSVSLLVLSIFAMIGMGQSNASKQTAYQPIKHDQCNFWTIDIGKINMAVCLHKGELPPGMKTSNSVSLQPRNFYSQKYQFGINFPDPPTPKNYTSNTNDQYNINFPCTSYILDDTTKTYSVYACKWPDNDAGFDLMSDADYKTTLKNFVTSDVQGYDGAKLINIKYKNIFSGHTLAADAHFIVYSSDNNGLDSNGYVREFTIGDYEYDIEADGVSESEFNTFAGSFQFTGSNPALPDNANDSIGHVSNKPTDGSSDGNGNVTNKPSGQPTSGNVSGEPTDGSKQVNGNFSTSGNNGSSLQLQ